MCTFVTVRARNERSVRDDETECVAVCIKLHKPEKYRCWNVRSIDVLLHNWLRFFRAFSSVVRQMPGWCPQRRGTARIFPNIFVALCIFCVALCIFWVVLCFFCAVLCDVCFVTFPVLFVCICVLNNCHRVATQLQLHISYHNCVIHTEWQELTLQDVISPPSNQFLNAKRTHCTFLRHLCAGETCTGSSWIWYGTWGFRIDEISGCAFLSYDNL
jgi:hypothetical protein